MVFRNFKRAYQGASAKTQAQNNGFSGFFQYPKQAWEYYKYLLRNRPIITNSLTSSVVAGVGDVLAQKLVHDQHQEELFQEASCMSAAAAVVAKDEGSMATHHCEPHSSSKEGRILHPSLASTTVTNTSVSSDDGADEISGPLLPAEKVFAPEPFQVDVTRMLRMSMWGILSGGPIFYWFKFLDNKPVKAFNEIVILRPQRNASIAQITPVTAANIKFPSAVAPDLHLERFQLSSNSMVRKLTNEKFEAVRRQNHKLLEKMRKSFGTAKNHLRLQSGFTFQPPRSASFSKTPYVSHGIQLTGKQRFFQNIYKVLVHQAVFAPLQNAFFFGWIFTSAMLEDHIRSLDYKDLTVDVRKWSERWKVSLLETLGLDDQPNKRSFPTRMFDAMERFTSRLRNIDSYLAFHPNEVQLETHHRGYHAVDPSYITDVPVSRFKQLRKELQKNFGNAPTSIAYSAVGMKDVAIETTPLQVPTFTTSAEEKTNLTENNGGNGNIPQVPSFREIASVVGDITGNSVNMLTETEKKYFDKSALFEKWGDKLLNDVAPVTFLALFVMGPVQMVNQYCKPEYRALIQALAFIGWSSYLSIVGHRTKDTSDMSELE